MAPSRLALTCLNPMIGAAMRTPSTPSAWYFSAIRTPLLLAGALATVGILAATGAPLAAVGQLSVAYFTAVNIVCWWLLHRRLRAEGRTFADLIRPGRIVPDIAWGLLWLLGPDLASRADSTSSRSLAGGSVRR